MNNPIDTLTAQQKVIYNDMIAAFYDQYDANSPLRLRFGQSFFNFYYGSVFKGSFPELYYCKDNEKAIEMITVCLVEYIKCRT
jgi:hypothetical protein